MASTHRCFELMEHSRAHGQKRRCISHERSLFDLVSIGKGWSLRCRALVAPLAVLRTVLSNRRHWDMRFDWDAKWGRAAP